MTVAEIFETMDYGPAPEGDTEARAWITKHDGAFGHSINGKFPAPGDGSETRYPATGEPLASVPQRTHSDVDASVSAARNACGAWSQRSGRQRARHAYPLAPML